MMPMMIMGAVTMVMVVMTIVTVIGVITMTMLVTIAPAKSMFIAVIMGAAMITWDLVAIYRHYTLTCSCFAP